MESCCITQETRPSALWQPRGLGWGWERGSRGRGYTYELRWLSRKEPTCNEGDVTGVADSIPGWENPWRRNCQPTPVFLPGKSHGCSWGCKRVEHSIMTKQQQWLIHIVVQQRPIHYKAIIPQLKKKLTHHSHTVHFFSVDAFRTRSGLIGPNLNPHWVYPPNFEPNNMELFVFSWIFLVKISQACGALPLFQIPFPFSNGSSLSIKL